MNIVPIILIVKGTVKKNVKQNGIYIWFRGCCEEEAAGVNFYNIVFYLGSKGEKLLNF